MNEVIACISLPKHSKLTRVMEKNLSIAKEAKLVFIYFKTAHSL